MPNALENLKYIEVISRMLLTFKVIVVITVNCYALQQTFTKQLPVLINCHTQGNQPHAM